MKKLFLNLIIMFCLLLIANIESAKSYIHPGDEEAYEYGANSSTLNPNPPDYPVRLIFIHHSTGENWLSDDNGGLGIALRDNNYYVSDTNYGWGPDTIGDYTDIGYWWLWFRGPNSSTYLGALYNEGGQNSSYSRLSTPPSGENAVIMFKSCFPNSGLMGNPNDTIPPIDSNPLRGESCGSEYHTVANAKGIYIDLLEYFRTRQDKLFVTITAPPLSDATYADNARAFNEWLVNEWLNNYPYSNVFVFNFYNVLTTNGGNANINDLNQETGNHHRWWNNAIQHKIDGDDDSNPNILEYPTDDDHPSQAGNLKATGEFVPLLNVAYHRWKGSLHPLFIDLASSYWASQYITAIYNEGITVGCVQDNSDTPENERKYCPENSVTREQMAAFIVRAREGEPAENYCGTGTPFPDVTSNMWSCGYIKRLKELGITTGYQDGTYGPYDNVPRDQMAAFLVRAKEGEPSATYCSTGSPFSDVDSNHWACGYIKRLYELGITTGCAQNPLRYCPNDIVTRAQMAAFLSRAFLGMQ